jgi:ribosomal protein L7/L12
MAGGNDQEIFEIKQRLALIEARLAQLFGHLQVAPLESVVPAGGLSDEVQQLLAAGNKAKALAVHREQTGLGLGEAMKQLEEHYPG